VAKQVGNVLNNKVLRLVILKYLNHVIKKITPLRAVKPQLLASLRKGLTRKACAQDVVRGYRGYCRSNVTSGPEREIPLVEISKPLVYLRRKHTFTA